MNSDRKVTMQEKLGFLSCLIYEYMFHIIQNQKCALRRGKNFILRSAPKKETLRRTELESLCEIYLRYMYGKSQNHPICQAGLENKFVKPEQLGREMGPFRNTEYL